jgi:hypothetical protein
VLRRKAKGLDHRRDDGGEAPVVSRSAGEHDHPQTKPQTRLTQDERLKASRHAEVARRYDRPSHRRGPPVSVLLAQLRRLLRHRRGDDLRGGLDAEIFATLGHYSLSSISAEKRGQLWQVTHEDQLRFDMRNFAPVDASRAQVRAFAAMIKGNNDYLRKATLRKQQRERKAALSSNNDLDVREEALFDAATDNWQTISNVMHTIGHGKAWRRPDGSKPSADGLRQAMHRAADALVSKGMIEEKYEVGTRGLPVRFIRRVFNAATKKER